MSRVTSPMTYNDALSLLEGLHLDFSEYMSDLQSPDVKRAALSSLEDICSRISALTRAPHLQSSELSIQQKLELQTTLRSARSFMRRNPAPETTTQQSQVNGDDDREPEMFTMDEDLPTETGQSGGSVTNQSREDRQ